MTIGRRRILSRTSSFSRGRAPFEEIAMNQCDSPVMTVDEVAAYLRIPRASVYKLAQKGKIPGQKVGRHWRFRRETIDQWLSKEPHARTEGHG